MIKLEKGAIPAILARNADRWTKTVVGKIASGETPTRTEKRQYGHPEVKNALLAETHGKCAYCESKLRHASYGHVEHIVPKSTDPSKWFSWPNLTIACEVCNTNKGDTFVSDATFVNPYAVDPEHYLWHIGSMICPRPGSDTAAFTERLLDLNRVELVERRSERITALLKMLELFMRCENPKLKDLLWGEFASEAEAHNEYAALSRTIVADARRKLGVE